LYVVIIAIFLALQGRCCAEDKYPMLSDKKRYTPLMLHLARALGVSHTLTVAPGKTEAGNMIDRPMQVTQLLKEALDNKFPSLSEAGGFKRGGPS
jgi:hypothetical protein